eukprot:m.178615 g.178615  ORF g.178615 m.178615 type:complete len:63 (+) comp16842_c0_seq3:1705-1893(+)
MADSHEYDQPPDVADIIMQAELDQANQSIESGDIDAERVNADMLSVNLSYRKLASTSDHYRG